MSDRANNFDLKLLTASKDVGLRRLRSYSASLGGGAQIFNSHDDLRRNLELHVTERKQSIVLHDNTVPMPAAQLAALTKLSRVFVLQKPDERDAMTMPSESAPVWDMESYMRCSLTAFLESPVVRMSMAQLCKSAAPFHLEHLLRWGYSAQTWKAGDRRHDVADASLAFIRSLNLVGEGRRLTEMASHFIQTQLGDLGLDPSAVTFGADGLLTMVIAKAPVSAELPLRDLVSELRVNSFPIAIVNKPGDGTVEVGALFYPFQMSAVQGERIVMVFNKDVDAVAQVKVPPVPQRLDEAG